MKISRIKIQNFRSIKDSEFQTTGLNIFVGQNNCGKTNFFEALEFFFNGIGKSVDITDLKFSRDENLEIITEIEFSGAQSGLEAMHNEANKPRIENALNGADSVIFVRKSSELTKRTMIVNGQEVNPGTGFDRALNDFIPRFEYVYTKQYYDSVAKYTKTAPMGIMLSGVLTTILENNEKYQEFQNKFRELFEDDQSQIKIEFDDIGNKVRINLQKQFPDCNNVKFEVATPVFDDLLKNFSTTIDDGITTDAEEKGDGMQRALMLAIIQTYSEYRKLNEDIGKSFLFFIDEAELHLHPTAQRYLKSVLLSLSQEGDQVFINTHSSVFVADNDEGQTIFKVEKNNRETSIEKVSDVQKPYIVFELLGGSPADLLFPHNFIIVEGQSEYELLTRVIENFYSDKPAIQIIKANGDIYQVERTINAIEKAYLPLNRTIYKDRLTILIDQPSNERQAGVNQFLQTYRDLQRNNQFFQLPCRDIEQCYPNKLDPIHINWRKTQAEVDDMDSRKKIQLAKHVGKNITQDEFENYLVTCYEALTKCWELSI